MNDTYELIGAIFLTLCLGAIIVAITLSINNYNKLKIMPNTIDSLVAVKVDSIIKARYGMFLKTQQDESMLLSELAHHRYLLGLNHPRYRWKLDGYQLYWEKKRWNDGR